MTTTKRWTKIGSGDRGVSKKGEGNARRKISRCVLAPPAFDKASMSATDFHKVCHLKEHKCVVSLFWWPEISVKSRCWKGVFLPKASSC